LASVTFSSASRIAAAMFFGASVPIEYDALAFL
jgi:hypothetical protein